MSDMNRRDAVKALAALATSAGFEVTPISTQETQGVELVLVKFKGYIRDDAAKRFIEAWKVAVAGTSIEHARVIAFPADELDIELVRTRP